MAVVALNGGVGTEKREAVLVILHLLRGDIPTLYGVTLGAIRTHLAAMNVRVTIGAILTNIRENGLDVAGDAFDVFVHTPQGIVSFVVIEFGNGTDGTPTSGGMTVLTRNVEWSVGIAGGLLLRVTRRSQMGRGCRDSRRGGCGVESKERPECELE